eukprot:6171896-Pleurochrysis_carterae.AAC.1
MEFILVTFDLHPGNFRKTNFPVEERRWSRLEWIARGHACLQGASGVEEKDTRRRARLAGMTTLASYSERCKGAICEGDWQHPSIRMRRRLVGSVENQACRLLALERTCEGGSGEDWSSGHPYETAHRGRTPEDVAQHSPQRRGRVARRQRQRRKAVREHAHSLLLRGAQLAVCEIAAETARSVEWQQATTGDVHRVGSPCTDARCAYARLEIAFVLLTRAIARAREGTGAERACVRASMLRTRTRRAHAAMVKPAAARVSPPTTRSRVSAVDM